jgi:hypothetical protein
MRIRYQVGLGLLTLLFVTGLLKSLATMALSGKGMTICPHCCSSAIDPSQRRAFGDYPFRLVGWLAYRCKVCSYRFYRPRLSAS